MNRCRMIEAVVLFSFCFWGPRLLCETLSDRQRFDLFQKEIIRKLDNREEIREVYLREHLKPLLEKCIRNNVYFRQDRPDVTLSISDFLTKNVGNHPNPYFVFSISYYMSSKVFRESPLEVKRTAVARLLKICLDDDYRQFHRYIMNLIVYFCCDSSMLDSGEIRVLLCGLVEKGLANHVDEFFCFRSILLLLWIDKECIPKPLVSSLRAEADKCDKFTIFISNTVPFASTVVLASIGNRKDLTKFLNFMHDNGKCLEIEVCEYLFPFASLVRTKETIMLLKEYLNSDAEEDKGEDVLRRYVGHASLAAYSLYTMLDGFPEPPDGTDGGMTDDYRKKCLAFLSSDSKPNFRKNLNWSIDDSTISRVRYRVFR